MPAAFPASAPHRRPRAVAPGARRCCGDLISRMIRNMMLSYPVSASRQGRQCRGAEGWRNGACGIFGARRFHPGPHPRRTSLDLAVTAKTTAASTWSMPIASPPSRRTVTVFPAAKRPSNSGKASPWSKKPCLRRLSLTPHPGFFRGAGQDGQRPKSRTFSPAQGACIKLAEDSHAPLEKRLASEKSGKQAIAAQNLAISSLRAHNALSVST